MNSGYALKTAKMRDPLLQEHVLAFKGCSSLYSQTRFFRNMRAMKVTIILLDTNPYI